MNHLQGSLASDMERIKAAASSAASREEATACSSPAAEAAPTSQSSNEEEMQSSGASTSYVKWGTPRAAGGSPAGASTRRCKPASSDDIQFDMEVG